MITDLINILPPSWQKKAYRFTSIICAQTREKKRKPLYHDLRYFREFPKSQRRCVVKRIWATYPRLTSIYLRSSRRMSPNLFIQRDVSPCRSFREPLSTIPRIQVKRLQRRLITSQILSSGHDVNYIGQHDVPWRTNERRSVKRGCICRVARVIKKRESSENTER